MAPEESSGTGGNAGEPRSAPAVQQEPPERKLWLRPAEVVRLAPRLIPHLRTPDPTLPELVDGAHWLAAELGVSQSLWAEACHAMGREKAAVAIAIVSTKPLEYFRTSAGGYFHGMVAKARAGKLNLERSIWGMQDRRPH